MGFGVSVNVRDGGGGHPVVVKDAVINPTCTPAVLFDVSNSRNWRPLETHFPVWLDPEAPPVIQAVPLPKRMATLVAPGTFQAMVPWPRPDPSHT
jgi:hypothetical protein